MVHFKLSNGGRQKKNPPSTPSMFGPGSWGPNDCGKSTLLKAINNEQAERWWKISIRSHWVIRLLLVLSCPAHHAHLSPWIFVFQSLKPFFLSIIYICICVYIYICIYIYIYLFIYWFIALPINLLISVFIYVYLLISYSNYSYFCSGVARNIPAVLIQVEGFPPKSELVTAFVEHGVGETEPECEWLPWWGSGYVWKAQNHQRFCKDMKNK